MTRIPGSVKRHGWLRGRAMLAIATACMLLMLVGVLAPVPRVAADSSVVWERYDVEMTVQADGTVHVVERQLVQFNGQFSHGFATIPVVNVGSIENVEVSIANGENEPLRPATNVRRVAYDEDPDTYTTYTTNTDIEIEYGFEPTSSFSGGKRLIVIEYDVLDGLRVYPDLDPANQQLWWIAIGPAVTEIAPIIEATVTITLPENVGEQFTASPALASNDGKTFTWTKQNLGSGDDFEVRLQFPPITSATVQPWQVRDDQVRKEREDAQKRSDLAGTFLFMAGALLAIGGGIGLFGIWYTKGRDPQVGPVADFLAEPPDDLRPGAAGTLIDEIADQRDVIASIVDLGNRGVLKIEDKQADGTSVATTQFTLLKAPSEVAASERRLVDSIFGLNAAPGQVASLTSVQSTFRSSATAIHDGYYQELVDHGYFTESPEKTRQRWSTMTKLIPLLAIGVAIAIPVLSGAATGWIVFPLIVGFVLTVVASRLAKAMPRKTLAGAEAAAKWRAFKTYLGDLDKYTSVENAQAIFQQYLPYAIAFGLESSWVSKFARVATPAPAWYEGAGGRGGGGRPVVIIPSGGGSLWGGSGNQGGGRSVWGEGAPSGGSGSGSDGNSGGGGGFPSWQDASDSAGRSMQGGSDSFLGMLQNVADALGGSGDGNSGSWGSSGGWSGSSGSSHRSSGGSRSSGGFSGGGSRGGGGGGGRRGFG